MLRKLICIVLYSRVTKGKGLGVKGRCKVFFESRIVSYHGDLASTVKEREGSGERERRG